jgi:hypothetical protein
VGDLVFKRYGEKVIISRKSDLERREPTTAQREQFRQAAFYGKMVMADAATKAIYEEAAKAKGQPVFSLTVADFFTAPSVDEVDLSGYAGFVCANVTAVKSLCRAVKTTILPNCRLCKGFMAILDQVL